METFNYLKRLSKNNDSKTIIMLHGVWSNMQDMFCLEGFLPNDYNVFSLSGQYDLGEDRHAWYHLSYFEGAPIYDKNEMMSSCDYIEKFILYIQEKYNISKENIFLLGFSQGAMMSNLVIGKKPEILSGIISLSARCLKELWELKISKDSFKGKNILICHGTLDELIKVDAVDCLVKYYSQDNVLPDVKLYKIAHNITKEEMKDIAKWLKTI